LQQFKSARYAKRALVVVTDGLDTSSKSTFIQVREQLKRSDVAVYSLGIGAPADSGSALGMEAQGVLDELSAVTGGEATMIHDKTEMKVAIEALSVQLRHQYRLGFRAPGTGTERWHRIKLKITPRQNAPEEFKKLSVTTRQGYYSK
jgi:Ca-activated chloride channel family protein